MNRILTWNKASNNGAFQVETEYGIFSDVLNTKPNLGIEYVEFAYIEQADRFIIDDALMADEQKEICIALIDSVVVPDSFYMYQRTFEHYKYLGSTDFYFTIDKYNTLSEDRKVELETKRQEARDLINSIEAEYNL